MRTGSVSRPCSSSHELNGEIVGPKTRITSMRAFMVKAKSPKVSWKRTPW
jgi:hypothetical protein